MREFFRRRLPALLAVSILLTTGLGCSPAVTAKPKSAQALTLNFWGVSDDGDAYADIIKAYNGTHPNVTINYRKFRLDEYESQLLNAMAEDRGPDIFMVHNDWVHAYQQKILPMPKQLKLAFRELQQVGLQKQAVWVERTTASISTSQVGTKYVDQVARDAVIAAPTDNPKEGLVPQIFGLPMSLDAMAMYYDKDVLNAAGIPTAAATWSEFQDHVKRMTRYDDQGKLVKPAAGIGTSRNVDRYFDILSLLMMQNGAKMADENGYPTFELTPANLASRGVSPAVEALVFYTDFANPSKDVFTWDDTQPNSYDAFIAGKTGYFFGYDYHLPMIRANAPKMNLGINPVPQIDPANQTNYANYWLLSVAKKSAHPNEAWDFVQFATSEAQVKSYLAKTAKPTALRSLITSQLNDPDLSVFASELLTAKSWYKGANVKATESAFADMIDSVLKGEEPEKAVKFASDTISQTIR